MIIVEFQEWWPENHPVRFLPCWFSLFVNKLSCQFIFYCILSLLVNSTTLYRQTNLISFYIRFSLSFDRISLPLVPLFSLFESDYHDRDRSSLLTLDMVELYSTYFCYYSWVLLVLFMGSPFWYYLCVSLYYFSSLLILFTVFWAKKKEINFS